MTKLFGEHWFKDLADWNDMRKRAGGTLIALVVGGLIGGLVFGLWKLPTGYIRYTGSIGLAAPLVALILMLVFMPRVLSSFLVRIGSLILRRRNIPAVPETAVSAPEPPPPAVANEVEAATADESLAALPGRSNVALGQLLVSYKAKTDGTPTDVRYHCKGCPGTPEVTVKLLPPERPGMRFATASGAYPFGATCPQCGRLLGQWSSKAAFDSAVRQALGG